MDNNEGKEPVTVTNAPAVSDASWRQKASLEGAVEFQGISIKDMNDVNRDGTGRRKILARMQENEEVTFELQWEDVFILSRMGKIGKLPANFLFFAKSGMNMLARLSKNSQEPAIDIVFWPSQACRTLIFDVSSQLKPYDRPVLCSKVDIEQKYYDDDEKARDADKGDLYVNYFDKTIGQVPAAVVASLQEAITQEGTGVAACAGFTGNVARIVFLTH